MPDLTLEKLLPLLLVVLPGYISIKLLDAFFPPEKREIGSSVLELIAFGLVNGLIWFPFVLYYEGRDAFAQGFAPWYLSYAEWYPVNCVFLTLCFLLTPALLALGFVWLRKRAWVTAYIGHATKTAWDDFFKRRRECWILFHLKSGKMLGGYFGEDSYATSFPIKPEVHVEEVWRVNERGEFAEKVDGTLGMVIRLDDCERMEFLCVEQENQNVQAKAP